MTRLADPPTSGPVVVLGAGYAGLTLAREVARRSRGRLPIVLVDRNPVHVLRTELYEIGKIAEAGRDVTAWTVPLDSVLQRTGVEFRQGTVESIDLSSRRLHLDTGDLPFGTLAICLGSVAAYYGVPGAAENTHQIYRLSGAQKLASAIREMEMASPRLLGERRPRMVIVGGGSTGTELAAEVASTDWTGVGGSGARPPDVFLLTGSLPFLVGLPPSVVSRAAAVLRKAGVTMVRGLNVVKVEPGRVHLEDGTALACNVAVWCAGLEAPPVVRTLPVPHGRAGRVAVEPTLEVPGFPGVFAVGDVIELKDPATGFPIPGTAQAALTEARTAAANLVARARGEPLVPFEYREKGVVVALGTRQGAGQVNRLAIWGSPAALLKRLVQRDYSRSVQRGQPPSLI